MDYKESYLNQGLKIEVNAKKELVLRSLEEEKPREVIARVMYEDSKKNHTERWIDLGQGIKSVQLVLEQSELEAVFDKIMAAKKKSNAAETKRSEEMQEMLELWEGVLAQNGTTKYIDVTNYLTYAMLESVDCIRQLREKIEKAGIYDEVYDAFEQSAYREQGFEKLIDARLVTESRLFRGLLVKFRQELMGEFYQMIMRILYAGYRNIKKELKRLDICRGSEFHAIQRPWAADSYSPLLTACVHMVIYVIAQDLNNRQVQTLKDEIQKQNQIFERKEEMQKEKLANYEQELAELRSYVYSMHEQWEEQEIPESKNVEAFWRGKRVLVVGGHSSWQKKLKDRFPKWQFLSAETKIMTADSIRDKEYIVCNTELLSHGTYYKLLAERKRNQKIFYVYIELWLKELNLQRGM